MTSLMFITLYTANPTHVTALAQIGTLSHESLYRMSSRALRRLHRVSRRDYIGTGRYGDLVESDDGDAGESRVPTMKARRWR